MNNCSVIIYVCFAITLGVLFILAVIDNYRNPPHGGVGAMG